MKQLIMLVALVVVWPQLVYAQLRLGNGTEILFATMDEAKQILTAQDDFVLHMSAFDRAARLKTNQQVSREEYLQFVGKNVRTWDDSEKDKINSVVESVKAELEKLAWPFPKQVLLIKSTGKEEGGAVYTRAHAIVLPGSKLAAPATKLRKTICHELFHVLSRANPDLREKLYTAIGFAKCNELAFPRELAARKITNPDAPQNDHCILLQIEGRQQWAIPILFSSSEYYDVLRGGEFFSYLQFQFLIVQRRADSPIINPVYDGQVPKLLDIRHISGFFEQVGNNTKYIIHPEEILADNFALLILREERVPSPEIVAKIERILKSVSIAASKPSE